MPALHFLLVEPVAEFGAARLAVGRLGARLPAGVHAVAAVAVPTAEFGAARLVMAPVGRLPAGVHAVAAVAVPTGTGADRASSSVFVGGRGALLRSTAGALSGAGRRGVVATRSAPSDDSEGAAELTDDELLLRSSTRVAEWVYLAQLKTTFEVAMDTGVLQSGRDLRRVREAIGEVDLTAPVHPWSGELCLDRVRAVVGSGTLNKLRSATTPEDKAFGWSAMAAQSVIEYIQILMVIILHARVMKGPLSGVPNLPIQSACLMFMKMLLEVLCEFTTIMESTKFQRPQDTIRYRMLEAHSLALEHAMSIALDIYEEVCMDVPGEEWIGLWQGVRERRLTLRELDIGLSDYMLSIGLTDTERVVDFLLKTAVEVMKSIRMTDTERVVDFLLRTIAK